LPSNGSSVVAIKTKPRLTKRIPTMNFNSTDHSYS